MCHFVEPVAKLAQAWSKIFLYTHVHLDSSAGNFSRNGTALRWRRQRKIQISFSKLFSRRIPLQKWTLKKLVWSAGGVNQSQLSDWIIKIPVNLADAQKSPTDLKTISPKASFVILITPVRYRANKLTHNSQLSDHQHVLKLFRKSTSRWN